MDRPKYCPEYLLATVPQIFEIARNTRTLEEFRQRVRGYVYEVQHKDLDAELLIRVRDCGRIINEIFTLISEEKARFSVAQAIRDIGYGRKRADLTPAFYAEILYLLLGLEGKGARTKLDDHHLIPSQKEGREAAVERSHQLDALAGEIGRWTARYITGLRQDSMERREKRRQHIAQKLHGTLDDWYDWRWQFRHIMRDADEIGKLVNLRAAEVEAIKKARQARLPFGITPYYLSLMDDDPEAGRDRGIRAQVIPPINYVDQMSSYSPGERACLDFMREGQTSPVDLITRRYPGICIFKPFNTCPQICVYCQRNWEIEDAMIPGAFADEEKIAAALKWIREHPYIHEVLITGGDPLGMNDQNFERILSGVAEISSVERIRIGTRTPVTVPMRLTEKLCDIIAKYRIPGKRQIAVVTHIEHAYELTPEVVTAVERLRLRGISVFNQLVYTFFVSRRFEAAFLRRNLARIGVEPYYSFNTKGKEETNDYRVPIARLLQEQKEEARLMPGLERTDEVVYNVPGMGKNYLRAFQHHDVISILPDGVRLYEFHPWEKNITKTFSTYLGYDVPILDYLTRLESVGEDISDYDTIWYYY